MLRHSPCSDLTGVVEVFQTERWESPQRALTRSPWLTLPSAPHTDPEAAELEEPLRHPPQPAAGPAQPHAEEPAPRRRLLSAGTGPR